MAVYTALEPDALATWLADHDVGTLIECQGIAAGIENSNFFVTTRDGDNTYRFVLTMFERLSIDELPFYLSLMKHLAAHGVPCPAPMADRNGALCSWLAGKPAALVTRLEGRSVTRPSPAHCAAMGTAMARMHLASLNFAGGGQANPRGIDWWNETARRVQPFLDERQRALLDDEMLLQSTRWTDVTQSLPRGAAHLDLFRDNVLFVTSGDGHDESIELRGIIDFYFAGNDVWLLDLAICLNDWCVDLATGTFEMPVVGALIDAYERERPLSTAERGALPLVLRAAALRFWLSRLDDLHRPRPAQLLTPHDPSHFERILIKRRAEAASNASLFDRPISTSSIHASS
jgi:homoserine kinase type II